MSLEIRQPTEAEKADWLSLWQGYLQFYACDLPQEMTDLTWQRIHDPAEPISCFCAYDQGQMVGMTIYVFHRSTWAKNSYCYLEDLFVAKSQRGKGVGRGLIKAVEQAAREAGSNRLYWVTDGPNLQAQAAYEKVATRTTYIQFRIELSKGA